MSRDDLCPMCGSENLEADDPLPGEKTCRDCGEIIDLAGAAVVIPEEEKQ